MTKYMNRASLTVNQEEEIFPILDAAVQLPFGKAILHKCSPSRADYLSRVLNGERTRSAILSISTYTPDEILYGKGLYHHLVIEPSEQGLLVANVEYPPETVTSLIIQCAATQKPVSYGNFRPRTVTSRLTRLKERYPQELGHVYAAGEGLFFAVPKVEELVIVDIDCNPSRKVPGPTPEDAAKLRQ